MSEREQHLSRRERRQRARQASTPQSNGARVSRRWFVVGGSLALGGAVAAAATLRAFNVIDFPEFSEEYSGKVEETKNLLDEWQKESEQNPKILERYLPRVSNLAIAFFANQMGYDKDSFKGRIIILDEREYAGKAYEAGCAQDDDLLFAFNSVVDNNIYISGKRILERATLKGFFSLVLHELHHQASPILTYDPPIVIAGLPQPISYEKGLAAFSKTSVGGRVCLTNYRKEIEEAVVQHSNRHLTNLLGFVDVGFAYEGLVRRYHNQVVVPLYKGEHKELLAFQQKTRRHEFFQSVGKRLGAEGESAQEVLGDAFVRLQLLNN